MEQTVKVDIEPSGLHRDDQHSYSQGGIPLGGDKVSALSNGNLLPAEGILVEDVTDQAKSKEQFALKLGSLVSMMGTCFNTATNMKAAFDDNHFQMGLISAILLGIFQIPVLLTLIYVFLKDWIKTKMVAYRAAVRDLQVLEELKKRDFYDKSSHEDPKKQVDSWQLSDLSSAYLQMEQKDDNEAKVTQQVVTPTHASNPNATENAQSPPISNTKGSLRIFPQPPARYNKRRYKQTKTGKKYRKALQKSRFRPRSPSKAINTGELKSPGNDMKSKSKWKLYSRWKRFSRNRNYKLHTNDSKVKTGSFLSYLGMKRQKNTSDTDISEENLSAPGVELSVKDSSAILNSTDGKYNPKGKRLKLPWKFHKKRENVGAFDALNSSEDNGVKKKRPKFPRKLRRKKRNLDRKILVDSENDESIRDQPTNAVIPLEQPSTSSLTQFQSQSQESVPTPVTQESQSDPKIPRKSPKRRLPEIPRKKTTYDNEMTPLKVSDLYGNLHQKRESYKSTNLQAPETESQRSKSKLMPKR